MGCSCGSSKHAVDEPSKLLVVASRRDRTITEELAAVFLTNKDDAVSTKSAAVSTKSVPKSALDQDDALGRERAASISSSFPLRALDQHYGEHTVDVIVIAALRDKYKPQPLWITIEGARDLRNADFVPGTGVSDPFCVIDVKGMTQKRIRTPTIDDNLNPNWNHKDVIDPFHPGDSLDITVYDEDSFSRQDLLGTGTLRVGSFEEGFDGEVEIKAGPDAPVSYVRLKIEPLDEAFESELSKMESWPLPIVSSHAPRGSNPFHECCCCSLLK